MENNYYGQILKFLNENAGKPYIAEQEPISTYGRLAYSSAQLLGTTVENMVEGFSFIKTSKWQSSGHIAKYFWLQFKRESHQNEPYSISITNIKKGGKYIFKVYIEVSDNDLEKILEPEKFLTRFNQAIIKLEQPKADFYYEGTLRNKKWSGVNLGSNANDFKKALMSNIYSKITTNIDLDVDEKSTDKEIIEKMITAFKILIPYYDAIWDKGADLQKTQTWIIPCDIQQYDIINAFKSFNEIEWHETPQTKDIKIGDVVYIYVTRPYSRLMYQCEVTKIGLTSSTIDDTRFMLNTSWTTDDGLFRLKLVKRVNSLNLSIDDLNKNGLAGNVQGARKLDSKTEQYIKCINEKSENAPAFDNEEEAVLEDLSELEIEKVFNEKDDTAGFIAKSGIIKTRQLNKKIIDKVKMLYKGQCQLCGLNIGEKYGVEITEAHHIEYFSVSQNNDSSNIIILCPNCHTLIHTCNAVYNKQNYSFDFRNGNQIKIQIIGHLKID